MIEANDDFFAPKQSAGFTVKEYLYKQLSYWPLFLISLVVCIAAGYFYTKYARLKYKATTMILVKEDKSTQGGGRGSTDLIVNAINGGPTENLDNEIQLLRSSALFERVVEKNQFNILYYKVGKFKNTDLYLDAPFRLVPQFIGDSNHPVNIAVKKFDDQAITIAYGPNDKLIYQQVKWNTSFKVLGNQFIFVPRGNLVAEDGNYLVVWSPARLTSEDILAKTTVDILDRKTTIIQLSILTENLKRGEDILNALSREFMQTDMDGKNAISQNTIRFIDDRLDIVSKELSGVEGNLEDFQGNNELINVPNQTTQSFENSNVLSKNLNDISIQQSIVQMLSSYFDNPGNQDKLVPSSLGINDATLTSLIGRYNELHLNKEREAPLLSSNSIVLTDINNQINDVKGSIIESLQNITKNLKLQQLSLQQKNEQYTQFLSSLPHKERVMQEIKRKQSITEGLYLYLLQKREETAISASSANVSVYKQIDSAKGWGPVEPNASYILGYSIILGLLLPEALIRLRSILNDKVSNRKEITDKVYPPILGELVHIPKRQKKGVAILERNLVSEQFRNLRTNINFFQRDKQVLLVTSSSIGEGKSLISLNLAAVMAMPGKKVALLEFDLRNPGICKKIGLNEGKGLTDFLTGETNSVSELYQTLENLPTLHIYPAGPLNQNPGDILISERVPVLFEILKKQYDYVIIDSAPSGLVSDAFIFGHYSDAVIYIVRLQHTLKKQLDFINDMLRGKKFTNIGIVINDVKTGTKYGYGYGYGNKYNYDFGRQKKKGTVKRGKPAFA